VRVDEPSAGWRSVSPVLAPVGTPRMNSPFLARDRVRVAFIIAIDLIFDVKDGVVIPTPLEGFLERAEFTAAEVHASV
jgi:hypothetical protein